MTTKPWDFLMFVEIGVDRVQHAFWKFFDKNHHLYVQGSRYENAIRDYYRFIDEKVGGLLKHIDNETVVIVVSDHGAKRMRGAFCINEWLIKKGYLALKKRPEKVVSLDKAEVDWSKTKAWGWGGYHARIYINVKGSNASYNVFKWFNISSIRSTFVSTETALHLGQSVNTLAIVVVKM